MKKSSFILLIFLCFVACNKNNQEVLLQRSDKLISEKNYQEAEELLRQAIKKNPDTALGLRATYKLGFLMETYQADLLGAISNYEEFIKKASDPVRVYEVKKRLGNLYFEQIRNFEKSRDLYRNLITENPESLELDAFSFRVGRSLFFLNEFKTARKEYQSLIETYPNSEWVARARYEIGNTYYMEEQYRVAIEALKQVPRIHPKDKYAIEAKYLMGQCYLQQGKYAMALGSFESIQSTYQPKALVEQRIAETKRRLGRK